MLTLKRMFLVATMLLAGLAPAAADELVIGSRYEPVTDPHYFYSGNNIQFYRHYFGFLTLADPDGQAYPSLAESYEQTETGWTFHLREGVVFSDGSAFDAGDVIASYERARDYENALGTYAGLFANISSMEAPDPLTLVINTPAPYPNLAFALSMLAIVPAEVAETAAQADFLTTAGSVSAGPFRFVSFTPGQDLVLERNPDYWGQLPVWEKVTFQFLTDPSARVAALLAGTVDMIDAVPPEFVERIREDGRFEVHTAPSMRNFLISVDHDGEVSPYVTGNDGAPLTVNPFRDRRVREALSIAIDREAIRDRVMAGMSFPTGQLVAQGIGGHSDAIGVPPFDPARARELLAEAGYPDGFRVTLHCGRDRYVNDVRICQTIAQMFARVGVRTEVVSIPGSAFFTQVNPAAGEGASIWTASWSAASSGEADVIYNILRSYDPEKLTGTWNHSRYSNPELDALADAFMVTMDQEERRAMMRQAMELAMGDYAIIPIHDQSVVVATRKGLGYTPFADDSTVATAVLPR